MNLSEYEYLWTTEKDDWVLVNTTFGYGIVNKTAQVVLWILQKTPFAIQAKGVLML